MVSKEEVEKLMLSHFSLCPLCGAKEGYKVSGIAKNYVQCKSCGAKWMSYDFIKCEELRNLILWEPSYDLRGESLAKKKIERSVDFWKDSKKVKKEINKEFEEKPKEEQMQEFPQKVEKSIFKMNDEQLHSIIATNLDVAEACSSSSSLTEISRILLSNPADARIMFLLQALVHQNKVIIGQNELLYRLLSKSSKVVNR